MITLQLLGIKGTQSTDSLMNNLLMAVESEGIIVKLEEVNDIDQFLRYDMSGIPALAINGVLAFQEVVPNVDTLALMLRGLK